MDTTKYPRPMCLYGLYPTMSEQTPTCDDCGTELERFALTDAGTGEFAGYELACPNAGYCQY